METKDQKRETKNQELRTKNQNCLMTSEGTLKITDFGLVKVGMPEETVTEQQAPMPVRLSIWGPSLANVSSCPRKGGSRPH